MYYKLIRRMKMEIVKNRKKISNAKSAKTLKRGSGPANPALKEQEIRNLERSIEILEAQIEQLNREMIMEDEEEIVIETNEMPGESESLPGGSDDADGWNSRMSFLTLTSIESSALNVELEMIFMGRKAEHWAEMMDKIKETLKKMDLYFQMGKWVEEASIKSVQKLDLENSNYILVISDEESDFDFFANADLPDIHFTFLHPDRSIDDACMEIRRTSEYISLKDNSMVINVNKPEPNPNQKLNWARKFGIIGFKCSPPSEFWVPLLNVTFERAERYNLFGWKKNLMEPFSVQNVDELRLILQKLVEKKIKIAIILFDDGILMDSIRRTHLTPQVEYLHFWRETTNPMNFIIELRSHIRRSPLASDWQIAELFTSGAGTSQALSTTGTSQASSSTSNMASAATTEPDDEEDELFGAMLGDLDSRIVVLQEKMPNPQDFSRYFYFSGDTKSVVSERVQMHNRRRSGCKDEKSQVTMGDEYGNYFIFTRDKPCIYKCTGCKNEKEKVRGLESIEGHKTATIQIIGGDADESIKFSEREHHERCVPINRMRVENRKPMMCMKNWRCQFQFDKNATIRDTQIYIITNKEGNPKYVGKANFLYKRRLQHIRAGTLKADDDLRVIFAFLTDAEAVEFECHIHHLLLNNKFNLLSRPSRNYAPKFQNELKTVVKHSMKTTDSIFDGKKPILDQYFQVAE